MCVEENAIFRVTLLVSGDIVFDEDHGMWGTIEYTRCILCDTVGFRRSFWIAVVGSPLFTCFRRYHRPCTLIRFFCVRKECFRPLFLRKDGILLFNILRNNGFR